MRAKIPVSVLGATGTVGQKFVRLLAEHPWFEVAAVAASSASAGKRYGEVVRWREQIALPDRIAALIVQPSAPPLPGPIVFSALDAEVAGPIEQAFAGAGAYVVTNTRTHRMDADVPLLIPEANLDHLALVDRQHESRGWPGAILANPNCSTAALVLALAPLHRAYGLEKLFVSTMQAVSGAGYPGVPSLDILGNVVPYIGGEEEKMERESRKILGTLAGDGVTPADFAMSAHTNRVATIDGHLMTVSAGFRTRVTPESAMTALREFRASPRVACLPSSPTPPVEVETRQDRPQPRLDLERGRGMAVTVGRVRACPILDLRLVLLGHNTIRGAAGQAVQIAELLVAEGRGRSTGMIVAKFGGTSVADGAAIGRLIGIVRSRIADRPVLVVSALARVTDGLLGLAPIVHAGDGASLDAAITALVDRHAVAARELPGAALALPAIVEDAAALRCDLGAALGRMLRPPELDALAGRGELWSSRLIAAALEAAGLAATWVDIRPIMVTDDRHGRAMPYMQALADRAREYLRPLVDAGRLPVTQGFIGATVDGTPTTLGRGGSDFTAALLGAVLDVERVEIWTDVNGLMTADPRIVPSARTLRAASYEEAAELATFGAKVLHPATAQPLVRSGIPIVVLNSTRPEDPGTTIEPSAELERMGDSPVRSISWKPGITVVNVRAPRMLGAYGFLRAMFEVFERHEVVVDVLASGEVSVSLTVEDRTRLDAVVRDLGELGEVWIEHHRAIIAVVGIGIRATPGLAARLFRAVQPANVEVISQGASAINMTFVVREEDGPDVVRRLHQEFFGTC